MRPIIKKIGSYYDKPLITEDTTDTEITDYLKKLYFSNKATIDEMFNKVQEKQHLTVLFYPNGHMIIGIFNNGDSLKYSEHMTGAAITKDANAEEMILYGIEERVYRTLKDLNNAIVETKAYSRR